MNLCFLFMPANNSLQRYFLPRSILRIVQGNDKGLAIYKILGPAHGMPQPCRYALACIKSDVHILKLQFLQNILLPAQRKHTCKFTALVKMILNSPLFLTGSKQYLGNTYTCQLLHYALYTGLQPSGNISLG